MKASAPRPSILYSLSNGSRELVKEGRGKKKKKREEYRVVEGVLARENIECAIMKNSVKISSV